MPNKNAACNSKQEALLEVFLSRGASASLSTDLRYHIEVCAVCRQYWENLGTVLSGFPEGPLYSPYLRNKTLRRLAVQEEPHGIERLPLIVLAALFSFSLSFVLPGWLLSKLLSLWTSSAAIAYGTACAALLLLGTLATLAVIVALVERGYIRLGNGIGIQPLNELPSMTQRNGFPSI